MINFPNAKINLGLNITAKRKDGFHAIETIFYPIRLADILEITPSRDNFSFTSTGIAIPDEDSAKNLCTKAYDLLNKLHSLPPVHIHLHKNIPIGAGLGGGSADAAFTLKMLNSMMKLGYTAKDLMRIAEKAGSDCPFFILNKPSFATAKGEVLTPISLNLKGYFLVLVYPMIQVNTAAAYQQVNPKQPSVKLTEKIKQPIDNWKETIKNDFEEIIFRAYPEIEKIKLQLYELGAVYASMSGSGSSVYGIFRHKVDPTNLLNNYFFWSEWI
ncbi:MAG: 4-(cytidine 5'-diphospho)-2-C-methyl-D-erythritol kinase [Bacteroidales bacterium]|jgi:4-diphosphocytidyl-2-C-methyl-D-erythritol kinase|nr:4-(cytidine 5'-diphospho)-2-C-methyl-D-erythritol kinase [Bacteroidales bacterium]